MAQTLEERLEALEAAVGNLPPDQRERVRRAVSEMFSSVEDLPTEERNAVLSSVQGLLRHVVPNPLEATRFPAHGDKDKGAQDIATIGNRLRR